jgi:hypothetical protein
LGEPILGKNPQLEVQLWGVTPNLIDCQGLDDMFGGTERAILGRFKRDPLLLISAAGWHALSFIQWFKFGILSL